jgi:single-strand DNA-binding protein
MPTLNRVQLIGRLGKDPETKFTPTGKKVTHFSIAVSERWKDKNGESKELRNGSTSKRGAGLAKFARSI